MKVKKNFSPKRPTIFQILGNSTPIIADYKDIIKCLVLICGLQKYGKKDGDLHTNHACILNIHSFESANFQQNSTFFEPTKQIQISFHIRNQR